MPGKIIDKYLPSYGPDPVTGPHRNSGYPLSKVEQIFFGGSGFRGLGDANGVENDGSFDDVCP